MNFKEKPERREKMMKGFFSSQAEKKEPPKTNGASRPAAKSTPDPTPQSYETSSEYLDLKVRLHQEVIRSINLMRFFILSAMIIIN